MTHNKTIDRLEDLLEQKEEELDELKREVERLKYMLDGSPDGWRVVESIKDDPSLPIPRLEMAFEPSKEYGWGDYKVIYRLVYQHLVDGLLAVPLGETRIRGGGAANRAEEPDYLPHRDGAHAAHDAPHFGLPLYRVSPSKPAVLVDIANERPYQAKLGLEHRRSVKP